MPKDVKSSTLRLPGFQNEPYPTRDAIVLLLNFARNQLQGGYDGEGYETLNFAVARLEEALKDPAERRKKARRANMQKAIQVSANNRRILTAEERPAYRAGYASAAYAYSTGVLALGPTDNQRERWAFHWQAFIVGWNAYGRSIEKKRKESEIVKTEES